ncbi:SseB family protein [Wenxinia saemankumensis]|uniref:SseB protein N-terminal domain-containing protein n=1 Tax=Wenxinia saemankumensis TaxID=1447782 RepID=A0A1M6DYF3_9RHOB|nr:SseB family protein [Wenxinia saemankumensis]SHI78175.1 SseB protein N-terminal domain-containing protein [Wenxinia saemankumensis]
MTETTPLDEAHAAMQAAPEDDALRLRYWERFAETPLSLLLEAEATGDDIAPRLIEEEGVPYLLAFDREDRLAEFAGAPAPTAGLSGRGLAEMLAGQGVGVALNPGAPSQMLVPPDALTWLAATLGQGPAEAEARPVALHPPGQVPDALTEALGRRLAGAAGLARAAWLAGVEWDGGGRGHLLAVTGARPGAEPALAAAVNEALTFSGLEAGALDVVFLPESDPMLARLDRVGLRFDIPDPPRPRPPGRDPGTPPRLR